MKYIINYIKQCFCKHKFSIFENPPATLKLCEKCGYSRVITNKCIHNWKWENWGITYQQGTCTKCGKSKIINQ